MATELTIRQSSILVANMTNIFLGCIRQSVVSRSKEVILAFCSALVRHIWVLCPHLASPVPGRCGHPGTSPTKSSVDYEGLYENYILL